MPYLFLFQGHHRILGYQGHDKLEKPVHPGQLVNDVIKEVTILVLEVCQVLNNCAMFIITNLIKGGCNLRDFSSFIIVFDVMIQD
jgi:hypothetical protein